MAKRTAKKTAKRILPHLTNALNKAKMKSFFDSLTEPGLVRLRYQLTEELYWWIENPTLERINKLVAKFPFLEEVIDMSKVKDRLSIIDRFEENLLGVHISKFMPELDEIKKECDKRFQAIKPNVDKAKLWLLPFAEDAAADSNVEAAVYFASRGMPTVDQGVLKKRWHSAICYSIMRGQPLATRLTDDIKKRASERMISLSEAAALLEFLGSMPRFFSYGREEEDFIDATFFRGIEWFNLLGFEPWLNAYASEISTSYSTAVEHSVMAWHLFFLCRSDLALKKIKKIGLESLLWGLINGPVERAQPWKQTFWEKKGYRIADYLPVASSIVFSWTRIKPADLDKSFFDNAVQVLYGTQMQSGAWPLWGHDTKGSVISTCFAIHALSIAKPNGWKQVCKSARDWLITQQQEVGCWHTAASPTVMLTVLVLDSIDLADGVIKVTFNAENENDKEVPVDMEIPDPTYDYSSEQWHNPGYPEFVSISKREAISGSRPSIALIVATEIELQQALYRLKPIKGKKIIKVSFGADTFFIGKFGKFKTVVVRSSMGGDGATGSTLTVNSVINTWKPKVVVLAGIAFGASKHDHNPGDVLIANAIIPYESQRVGEKIIFRSPIPPSSPFLINRFQNAVGWKFYRPDKTMVSVFYGPLLSGAKLVDNVVFKKSLLDEFPTAIGGEMEGTGLHGAAARNRTEWIVVKSVCDWADGYKHKSYQELAAASSMSICEYVFNDPHALDGI
jgi:nucleoside phosphorylase